MTPVCWKQTRGLLFGQSQALFRGCVLKCPRDKSRRATPAQPSASSRQGARAAYEHKGSPHSGTQRLRSPYVAVRYTGKVSQPQRQALRVAQPLKTAQVPMAPIHRACAGQALTLSALTCACRLYDEWPPPPGASQYRQESTYGDRSEPQEICNGICTATAAAPWATAHAQASQAHHTGRASGQVCAQVDQSRSPEGEGHAPTQAEAIPQARPCRSEQHHAATRAWRRCSMRASARAGGASSASSKA